MNNFEVFLYFVCFALIAGGAFTMMWANIMSLKVQPEPVKRKHPEAPREGEEVMYVDLSRERLEDLYKQNEQ